VSQPTTSGRAHLVRTYPTVYGNTKQGVENWMGMSLFFPVGYQMETVTKINELYFQQHGVGGSQDSSPPLTISKSDFTVAGEFQTGIYLRAGDKNGGPLPINQWLWTLPNNETLTTGVWHDFIIRYKISQDPSGYVQAWWRETDDEFGNGGTLVEVVDYTGITTYWDSTVAPPKTSDGWYPAWGLYKPKLFKGNPNSSTTDITVWNDKITGAVGTGGGSLVDPKYS
jgi:hypothetical protein